MGQKPLLFPASPRFIAHRQKSPMYLLEMRDYDTIVAEDELPRS